MNPIRGGDAPRLVSGNWVYRVALPTLRSRRAGPALPRAHCPDILGSVPTEHMVGSRQKYQKATITLRKDFTENLWSIRIQPQQRLEFKPRQYAGWRRAQLCGPQARMKSCRPIAPQKLGAAIGAATQELQSAYLLCKVGFGDDDPKRVARTAAFVVRVFSAP